MSIVLRIWKIQIICILFQQESKLIEILTYKKFLGFKNNLDELDINRPDRSLFELSHTCGRWSCDLFWCLKVF